MQIASGSVFVNGGTIPPYPTPTPTPEPTTNNLAIILGICIPLGVISTLFCYLSYWCHYLFRCGAQIMPKEIGNHLISFQQHHSSLDIRTHQQGITNHVIPIYLQIIKHIPKFSLLKPIN